MTALTIARPQLPSAECPEPSVTNQPLLRRLLAGGFYQDRVRSGEITKGMALEARALAGEIEATCQPANPAEAAAVIERLFSHYPRSDLTPNAAVLRVDDWLDDLEGIPLDVLQAAARDYRRSSARFAPTPGQFLECVKPYWPSRRAKANLLRMIADFACGPSNTPTPQPENA